MPDAAPAAPAAPADAPAPPVPLPGGLLYVDRRMPGLQRVRRGKRFAYRDDRGRWIRDESEVARINRLAIPPAYTEVWICPLANGHLQATGLDARGRRQYRYHPDWRLARDEDKFERMQAFGRALPRIRARVARDLAVRRGRQPLTRTVVLATVVRLLDTTFLRVGNEEYAASNGSYGLTTLRTPHAAVRGSTVRLRFRGKSGVAQQALLNDPRVARIVRRCQQLPGQELFQYEDEDGQPPPIGSADVNDYLRGIAGAQCAGDPHFTAKDFCTWHGTVQALELTRLACTGEGGAASWSAKQVLAEVARQLGNTPAVCKKSYVHPAVLDLGARLASDAGPGMQRVWERIGGAAGPRGLSAAERRLLGFLRQAGPKVRARKNLGRRAMPAGGS
ncbi:DNA topoisomerase IB [Xylophilus sp.]|uniref:DNA topoisomerase IB n=1 Tax=Xylophilus sp. TaxID=2653893 RepID=UPI0013B74750|nr:DNA topoisomerase IB [Xylophilus sp.]KAF1048778.1 MAG: hypothetical protein GAK38_01222 [Xylophilus sp.]